MRRKFVRSSDLPMLPAYRKIDTWLSVNRSCYFRFRTWLYDASYSPNSINSYGVVVRLIFSLISKPYLEMDPETDLNNIHAYVDEHYDSKSTRREYHRAIRKFKQFLDICLHRQPRPKPLNWSLFTGILPAWLTDNIREYLTYRRRSWLPENQHKRSIALLSQLTTFMRWLARGGIAIHNAMDITPKRWLAYIDARLAQDGQAGVGPVSLNIELSELHSWLVWLGAQGHPVNPRMLEMEALATHRPLPRDVPAQQLKKLQDVIYAQSQTEHRGEQRRGLMDLAWFLLMLHSGLRLNEIRRLKLNDIDWERRLVRIEQSKGLNDRLVPVSQTAIEALRNYLAVRGPAAELPDHVFIKQHTMLSMSYCGARLKTYGISCGVNVTPHRLRHSCATLLLNSGAPIVTVRAILGHQHLDTTMRYARLYDGTAAADYVRAMVSIEQNLPLSQAGPLSMPISFAQAITMMDVLRSQGTLNQQQLDTLNTVRMMLIQFNEQLAQSH